MLFFNIKRFKLINFFEQYFFFISSVSNKFCACLCCVKRGEVCKILQRSFLFFIFYFLSLIFYCYHSFHSNAVLFFGNFRRRTPVSRKHITPRKKETATKNFEQFAVFEIIEFFKFLKFIIFPT